MGWYKTHENSNPFKTCTVSDHGDDLYQVSFGFVENLRVVHKTHVTGLVQASRSKIQGLFKDF